MAARQTLWQLHACALPVGTRTGGDGLCPISAASEGARVPETHAQIALLSPLATRVWAQLLFGLRESGSFDLSCADGFIDQSAPLIRDLRRLLLLGLWPTDTPPPRRTREVFRHRCRTEA